MTPESRRPHVVVIGGGIAGLAAANHLTRLEPKVAVTLLEADNRLGGKMLTEYRDGFVIEGGPDSFLSAKPRGIGLCTELGLGDALQGTTPRGNRAFVSQRGQLYGLPEGLTGLVPTRLGPMARSPLLSPRGKARLALDYLVPTCRGDDDESLAAFIRRRLGREAYDHLIEPLMAGIYAGDGNLLSLAATFPQLRQAERKHGGLIRGVLAEKKEREAKASASVASRPAFLTPRRGLAELVAALKVNLARHGVELKSGTAVRHVHLADKKSDAVYRISLASDGWLDADAVVIATPAPATAAMIDDLDESLGAELRAIPHASSAIVSLAYRTSALPRPLDGYGYVIPRIERRPALACTWSSSKWEGRAPEGFALLRVFIGRYGQAAALQGGDDDLRRLARAELRSTLDITADPEFALVHRWPDGMPQYTLGHLERLANIERRLAAHPGLCFAGNAYRGVGLPDCIQSGEAAARTAHAVATRAAAVPSVTAMSAAS